MAIEVDGRSDRLLEHLRVQFDCPLLAFASGPTRFATGVENLVYALELKDAPPALSGDLVLRLYMPGTSGEQARTEATIQNSVAGQGYRAPRARHVCESADVLGGPFILMDRLPGRPMLEPLTRVDAGLRAPVANWRGLLFRMPEVLGELMSALHDLDADALRRDLSGAGLNPEQLSMAGHLRSIEERVGTAGLAKEFSEGVEWIKRHLPAQPARLAICHGDFWFGNLLEEGKRVTGVVDWSRISVLIADPAYDVGTTSVMLAGGMADIPRALRMIGRVVQQGMSRRFIRAYERTRSIDMDAVRYYQLVRCIDYLSFVACRRLDPALRAREERDMLDIAGSTEGIEAIFRKGTGIALPMPPR